MTICGCKSSLCSMMTVPIRPVASSTSRLIVTPAIISRNSILPILSVRIGTLYGFHCTKVSAFFMLENFTGRLRHQSTHAGELTHLLTITARSGIDHQIHRIQFLAPLVVFESPEQDAGNFVSSVRPDVDNLVVTLAVRDDAFAILLLDLPDLLVSIFELGLFLLRNDHVRNSNRETGLGRFGKPKLL